MTDPIWPSLTLGRWLFPCYRWRNWGLERSNDWPQTTKLRKAEWGLPCHNLLSGFRPTDGRRRWPLLSREKCKKLHLLIDFHIFWDHGKFGWASCPEPFKKAEPWLSQDCVWSSLGAQSQAPDSLTHLSHYWARPNHAHSIWMTTSDRDWAWHHLDSTSALKLPTCPFCPNRKDLYHSCPEECWFPSCTSNTCLALRWRQSWEGENHVGTVWSGCQGVATTKLNINKCVSWIWQQFE